MIIFAAPFPVPTSTPRALVTASKLILTGYFGLVVPLMNLVSVFGRPAEYAAFFGVAESLALASASALALIASAKIDPFIARRFARTAQVVFGLCALFFGGAHFVYPAQTIPLVPRWLPPSQPFWAYATGAFHIAAGVAIIIEVRARLAAVLLTIMYAAFTPLVHMPLLLSDPTKPFFWTENALNLALAGAAWVLATSLIKPSQLNPK